MRTAPVERELESLVEPGEVTAAQVAIAVDGDLALSRSFGARSRGADTPAVADDSPFLVASITKPVTATAVMQCVERVTIALDAPVSEYVPEFTGDGREAVTPRHLLTHTSGLPDMLPDNEALRRRNAPRSAFVERATGRRLREVLRRRIFDPLGMDDTVLGTDGYELSELVDCDVEEAPGDPGHDRWDWNSAYWRDFGAPWGGLHSTARDLTTVLQAFLDGGARGDARILEPSTVRAMTSLRTHGLDTPWGLGWALRDSRPYFGEAASPGTFGHGGATGTVAWADPERRVTFVCLTTRPLREHEEGFFADLSDAVIEAADAD